MGLISFLGGSSQGSAGMVKCRAQPWSTNAGVGCGARPGRGMAPAADTASSVDHNKVISSVFMPLKT